MRFGSSEFAIQSLTPCYQEPDASLAHGVVANLWAHIVFHDYVLLVLEVCCPLSDRHSSLATMTLWLPYCVSRRGVSTRTRFAFTTPVAERFVLHSTGGLTRYMLNTSLCVRFRATSLKLWVVRLCPSTKCACHFRQYLTINCKWVACRFDE